MHRAQRRHFRRTAVLATLVCGYQPAAAASLGTVDGFRVRWDSTLRDTLAFRVAGENAALLGNINADDGDRAFAPGLVSARLDLFTEFAAERDDLGADVSAQGWYDPLYHQNSDGNSPATFNPYSVPYDSFPRDTRRLMGSDPELVNAFARGNFSLAGTAVSLRAGRQTLLWGESLFFAQNGIAGGQAPVDEIKALGAPLAEARELYLPVTQAVARIALRADLALEAYDQVEWRRDRLPGVASYFSTTDILDAGGERVLLPDGSFLRRGPDSVPGGIGQFGVALRLQRDTLDLGLYALRFDAKLPEPVFNSPAGQYRLVFPRGIDLYGASASTYLGDANVAGEISFRRHMPLAAGDAGLPAAGAGVATPYADPPPSSYAAAVPAPPQAAGHGAGFATGDTWHAQASIVQELAPARFWQGVTVQAEVAANDLLEVTSGHASVRRGRTHFAASAEAVVTPHWYHVLPGLDVSLPVGITCTPVGRSSIAGDENAGSGEVTVGIAGTFRAVWDGALSFTHFIGGATAQPLADRDFVAVSVTRTF